MTDLIITSLAHDFVLCYSRVIEQQNEDERKSLAQQAERERTSGDFTGLPGDIEDLLAQLRAERSNPPVVDLYDSDNEMPELVGDEVDHYVNAAPEYRVPRMFSLNNPTRRAAVYAMQNMLAPPPRSDTRQPDERGEPGA